MATAISSLVDSPLADRFDLEVILTHSSQDRVRRLTVFALSLLRLAAWCMRGGRRIVHVHMAARGSMYRKATVVLVAKAFRRPVLLHVHAGPGDLEKFLVGLGRPRIRILRACFGIADVVVSVSGAGAEVLRRYVLDGPIAIVPNAPPPVVAPRPPREGGRVRLLYLGGFANPAKGGEVLFEALPAIVAANPELEIVLAGPGSPPGPLPARCEWAGWLEPEERQRQYDRADVFVMPSRSEGMPIALLEAMSNRIPVVATRVGGIGEILTDAVDAMLVDPGQPEQLVAAVSALAADAGRRAELAAAGAARMESLASEDVYQRLSEIYGRLGVG